MTERKMRTTQAAYEIASLVPHLVDDENITWARVTYDALSTGEQAAYDLARELFIGSGPLSRYVLFGDARYAQQLVRACVIAMANVTVPVDHRVQH